MPLLIEIDDKIKIQNNFSKPSKFKTWLYILNNDSKSTELGKKWFKKLLWAISGKV